MTPPAPPAVLHDRSLLRDLVPLRDIILSKRVAKVPRMRSLRFFTFMNHKFTSLALRTLDVKLFVLFQDMLCLFRSLVLCYVLCVSSAGHWYFLAENSQVRLWTKSGLSDSRSDFGKFLPDSNRIHAVIANQLREQVCIENQVLELFLCKYALRFYLYRWV